MKRTSDLENGDTLPNGATFLNRRRRANGKYILLCQWGPQFITWQANDNSDDTYWGHYFTSLKAARKDLSERVTS